jgi:hypothetical protein
MSSAACHHESVLLVVASAGPASPELEKALEAVKMPEDSAKLDGPTASQKSELLY